jgi:hypothetical protein
MSVLPRLLIFDVDGTLRYTTTRGQGWPRGTGEWRLLPGVRDVLAGLDWGPRMPFEWARTFFVGRA